MKTHIRLLVATFLLIAFVSPTHAIVGYVNRPMSFGDNLFANPLMASPDNTLSTLFSGSPVPNGTTVSLWNPTTMTFDTTSTFAAGSWSLNFTLNPGTGARLTAPSTFTATFVGAVVSRTGGPLDLENLALPPVYSGPNGLFLMGDKLPMASSGNNIFLHILGRAPNVGEQVRTLTTTSTYLGGGNWDLLPSLGVSDAVFLNVGPVVVPEPAAATLALVGVALLHVGRRRCSFNGGSRNH